MDLLTTVSDALRQCSQPYRVGDQVVVPTLLSYENGRAIQAYVQGGSEEFIVSDGGVAAMCFVSLGGQAGSGIKHIKSAASSYGLRGNGEGWIYSPRITLGHLPTYIAMVSECSYAVDVTLRKVARKQNESRDFKDEVIEELRREQGHPVIRRKHYAGASNKQHVFDFSLDIGGERTLVVDAVVPDPNSINSAVVAHLDLRQADHTNLVQRIVYNDRLKWSRSDLALLGVGAPTIPFSALTEQVHRLAA